MQANSPLTALTSAAFVLLLEKWRDMAKGTTERLSGTFNCERAKNRIVWSLQSRDSKSLQTSLTTLKTNIILHLYEIRPQARGNKSANQIQVVNLQCSKRSPEICRSRREDHIETELQCETAWWSFSWWILCHGLGSNKYMIKPRRTRYSYVATNEECIPNVGLKFWRKEFLL
jgi:hypothetical protein